MMDENQIEMLKLKKKVKQKYHERNKQKLKENKYN